MTRGDFILGILSSLVATILFELSYKFHARFKQLVIQAISLCRTLIKKVSAQLDIKTIRPVIAKGLVCTVLAIILLLPSRLDEGVLHGNKGDVELLNKFNHKNKDLSQKTRYLGKYDLERNSNDAFIRRLREYATDAEVYIEDGYDGRSCILKALSKTGMPLWKISARCGTPEQMYRERMNRRAQNAYFPT